MGQILRTVCGISVICGAALLLTPDGRQKRVMQFVCAAVLLAGILSGVKELNMDDYALETALYRERERIFLENSGRISAELNRRVIEEQCEAYLLDKAAQMGIPILRAEVSARWDTEGVWVPYAVRFEGECSEDQRARLGETTQADLGIPANRQEWG